jgi:hypothetical protein
VRQCEVVEIVAAAGSPRDDVVDARPVEHIFRSILDDLAAQVAVVAVPVAQVGVQAMEHSGRCVEVELLSCCLNEHQSVLGLEGIGAFGRAEGAACSWLDLGVALTATRSRFLSQPLQFADLAQLVLMFHAAACATNMDVRKVNGAMAIAADRPGWV